MSNRATLGRRETVASPAPGGTVEPAAIRLQLHRLLESPSFRSSKRCRHFLEHVVEHSLTTDAEPLKERTLGTQVFGREPSYDTADDPIVRVTAGDIRRRLGQYYADPTHQRELRVELPAGSYTPHYVWPSEDGGFPHLAEPHDKHPNGRAPQHTTSTPVATRARARALVGAAGLLGVLALLGALTVSQQPAKPFDRFWAPMLQSKTPVLLCTGSIDVYELPPRIKRAADAIASAPVSSAPVSASTSETSSTAASDPNADPNAAARFEARDVRRVGAGFVSVADAVALVRLAALFQERGTPYQIRENRATSFADLRTSPTVLVGMFSNAWTLQLLSELRFVPAIENDGAILIRDRQHPERRDWQLQQPWPALALTRDYALVSRVLDPATGTMVVVGAGITPFGTTAAAELLTSRERLDAVLDQVRPDWPTHNLQIVLETRVIGGAAAPPHVLATHVW